MREHLEEVWSALSVAWRAVPRDKDLPALSMQMPAGRTSLPAQLREQVMPSQIQTSLPLLLSPPPSLLLRFRRGVKGTGASEGGGAVGRGREGQCFAPLILPSVDQFFLESEGELRTPATYHSQFLLRFSEEPPHDVMCGNAGGSAGSAARAGPTQQRCVHSIRSPLVPAFVELKLFPQDPVNRQGRHIFPKMQTQNK